MYHIIPLSGDPDIGRKLAPLIGGRVVSIYTKEHPDGEQYIRLGDRLSGKRVLIVQSMFPDQDRRYVELLLAIDAAIRAGASRVDVLISYLAYARQDKVFLEGEPISVGAVLKSIRAVGAERLYVVEPHSEAASKIYGEGFIEIDGISPLARAFAGGKNIVIFSPDLGGVGRARRLQSVMDSVSGVYYIEKLRDRYTGEVVSAIREDIDLRGKTVLIVDDIISTGGTIANASRLVRERGASKVYVACAHPLFIGDSINRIRGAGVDRIVCGRTVRRTIDGVEYIELHDHIARRILEESI